MVSKGKMWVFDSSRITQPQSQISTDSIAHFTLAHHRVSSSSVVRASALDHGGSWVRIPSGARILPLIQLRTKIHCNIEDHI